MVFFLDGDVHVYFAALEFLGDEVAQGVFLLPKLRGELQGEVYAFLAIERADLDDDGLVLIGRLRFAKAGHGV